MKRILLVYSAPLFPMRMASQARVRLLARELHRRHDLDLVTLHDDAGAMHEAGYREICRRHFPILVPNHKGNPAARAFYAVGREISASLNATPASYYYPSLRANQKAILRVAEEGRYDIIQFEYWFAGKFVEGLSKGPFIAIDTHDVLHLKSEMELRSKHPDFDRNRRLKRLVEREREMEHRTIGSSDLVISISPSDHDYFETHFSGKRVLLVPTGMDLAPLLSTSLPKHEKPTILFYGSMGSLQNITAFDELWEKVLPAVRREIPEVQVKVVGANPPERIRRLASPGRVEVTGFVEDIAAALSPCHAMVLPMTMGGGFRTRLVEVMTCGVPIVGTHIAVDSLGFRDGEHGFVSDDPEELAARTVRLLRDEPAMGRMGAACRAHAAKHFSAEATYGRLSDYYESL